MLNEALMNDQLKITFPRDISILATSSVDQFLLTQRRGTLKVTIPGSMVGVMEGTLGELVFCHAFHIKSAP